MPVASFDAVYCAIWRRFIDWRARRGRHDGVAAGGVDHGGGVLGGADVAVADDGDAHGVFHGGDVLPARLAGVAVLAGARVQGDCVEAAVLGEAGEVYADDLGVAPSMRNLTVKGMETEA